MSSLKWHRWGAHGADCEIGPLLVTAYARSVPSVIVSMQRVPRECAALDEAQIAAETKLRETYDALRDHFDPVPALRWIDNGDGESVALDVDGWTLGASHGNWWLSHPTLNTTLRSPRPNPASEQDNRRAAEDALRSLGVRFAVEGGE